MLLLYGEEYAIRIFSRIGEGTRVEMRIPPNGKIEAATGEFSPKRMMQESLDTGEDKQQASEDKFVYNGNLPQRGEKKSEG